MATKTKKAVNKNSFFRRAGRDLKKNKYVYILFIPVHLRQMQMNLGTGF